MRFRTLVLAAGLSAGIVNTSRAFVPNRGGDAPTAYGAVGARMHRDTGFVHTIAKLPSWQGLWDRDTDVPLRLWGPGITAANSVVDPTAAEAAARAFLAAHLDLLAPGAALSDFTLIANQLDGDLRSVAFEQRVNGLRVLGGAIGFGFKNDRLFIVNSTALPHVSIAVPTVSIARPQLAGAAAVWLAADGFTVRPTVSSLLGAPGERVIVPIVRPRIGKVDVRYQVAEQLPIEEVTGPGRWNVWLDATSGAPIVRQSQLSYATGTVLFDTPDQSPSGTRSAKPAPFVNHAVAGLTVESDATGTVTWAGTAATMVQPGLVGPLIKIVNSGGSLVTDTLTLQPGGTVTWSQSSSPTGDAQLDSYVNANTVKAFAKTRINPQLAWLDTQLTVNVNENDTCNAFWDGQTLNFFLANTMCENTGRMRDVVFHEFGHGVHNNSFIPGIGAFDGSLSEGLADTLAVSITGDSGLGRGFFFNDMPLRELAPAIKKRWPQDADGEVHDEGEIIGETLWDLRQNLQTSLGQAAGFDKFLHLYYAGVVQRAADIPSAYLEVLAADDDDGDITNGTPNLCAINAAFGPHGLTDPAFTLGLSTPIREGNVVHFDATTTKSSQCPGAATLSGGKLDFHIAPGAPDTTIAFTQAGNTWSATIPTQPDGTVVEYRVTITLSDTSSSTFPDNPADPYYQYYLGAVTKLYCTDFESGAADWTHAGTRDEWQVGAPKGLGGDPKLAHGGTAVFGTDLSTDGLYKNNGASTADGPMVDLQGFTSVRLQYYRWLTVEDGAYDTATIYANGAPMWTNLASPANSTTEVNHIDKEWRFQDVDLSAQAASGKIQVRFEIKADPGLNLGGWNLDDLCIVGVKKTVVPPTCGNGVLDTGEACDDGNTTDGDGCSATCGIEVTDPTMPGKDGGGCCSTGTSPTGALALGGIVLGALLRRRRRR